MSNVLNELRSAQVSPTFLCVSCFSGSFATVKIGTQKSSGDKFAIKIINRANLEAEDEEALESEVKIMEKVSHPNIINLVEVFDSPKKFYMVMEVRKCVLYFWFHAHELVCCAYWADVSRWRAVRPNCREREVHGI